MIEVMIEVLRWVFLILGLLVSVGISYQVIQIINGNLDCVNFIDPDRYSSRKDNPDD